MRKTFFNVRDARTATHGVRSPEDSMGVKRQSRNSPREVRGPLVLLREEMNAGHREAW